MLQRYKLRLSDGTLLVVDHDALSSWVVDGKAMVQPVGSDRWLSLKKFLLEERRTGSPWWSSRPSGSEIPGVHRSLLSDDGALPPVRPARELPLIPPPSRRVPTEEIVAAPESTSSSSTLDTEPPVPAAPLPIEPEASNEVEVSLANAQVEPLPSISEPPSIWLSAEPAAAESFPPPAVPAEESPIILAEPLEAAGTPEFSAAPEVVSEGPEPAPTEVLNLHAVVEEAAAPPEGFIGRPSWRQDNAPIIGLKPLGEEGAPRQGAVRRWSEPREAPPSPAPR
jgi:hypothetical protein